ncbi:MAG: hypothetical protein IKA63_02075 [Clostridia bacterium]|nr:hypothetical protein [Clostridia bacterium]
MFGYIKTYQPELKMGEFEQYRGVYCALCRRLGKRYGLLAQLSLSYDFTFLALMRLALAQECAGFRKARCPYNPLKKRNCCCDTEQLDAVADAAVLLTYHKLRDTVADSGFWKGLGARLLLPLAAHDRKRCAARHPDWDAAVAQCMQQQAALETERCTSIDAAAEPTAKLLEFFFTLCATEERQQRVLARFGYCLGRWIYLMDAADDLPDDIKNGSYNPLITDTPDAVARGRERVRLSLNASMAECKAAYELLDIRRFDGILRNVLELGMAQMQQQVLKGENSHERSV